jgi:hypothetical protein
MLQAVVHPAAVALDNYGLSIPLLLLADELMKSVGKQAFICNSKLH